MVRFRQSSEPAPAFLDIAIPATWPPEAQAWDWQPGTLAGRPGQCLELDHGRRCAVTYGDVAVGIETNISVAELEQILAGLLPADPADPSTWYDIDEAVRR